MILVVFIIVVSLCCLPCSEATERVAIARTFSVQDAPNLPASFAVWEKFPPCDGYHGPLADLFLVFSQSLETSNVAQSSIEEVKLQFEKTAGWGNCIGQVVGFGVDIDPKQDIYKTHQQETNPMWVNGPNRQFERTIRAIENGQWGSFEFMYLMELDSVPVQNFWLDAIVNEKKRNQDTAIIGSKYRGDKWDPFLSTLPPSLVNHINGNALYNLTHPFLKELLLQLELEASTAANSIPYDYRISQIIWQLQTNEKPTMLSFQDTKPPPLLRYHLRNTASHYDLSKVNKDTPVIGNYASTNIVPAFLDSNMYIAHGAKMRQPWNEGNLGEVTLVISDWGLSDLSVLATSLYNSLHPFSKLILITPKFRSEASDFISSSNISAKVVQRKEDSSLMDLCHINIETSWFMITDTYYQLRSRIDLMTDDSTRKKPIVSFLKASNESCFAFPYCKKEFELALRINSSTQDIYQSNDFLFHTKSRNDYCRSWRGNMTDDMPPSATSYVAFLKNEDKFDDLYLQSDRAKDGSRSPFVPVPDSLLRPNMLKQRRLQGRGNSNETNTCSMYTSENLCLESSTCSWRDNFESCYEPQFAPSSANRSETGRPLRPTWVTFLLSLTIGLGAMAIIALLIKGAHQTFFTQPSESDPVPVSDSNEDLHMEILDTGGNGVDEISLVTVELEGESIPLSGRFEENSTGVEFISDDL